MKKVDSIEKTNSPLKLVSAKPLLCPKDIEKIRKDYDKVKKELDGEYGYSNKSENDIDMYI
ncbi:MAG: hypothetical protein FWE45_01455 [Firmicutes bacterium]|nr:hypothetical protein [Bacillota bacterium]